MHPAPSSCDIAVRRLLGEDSVGDGCEWFRNELEALLTAAELDDPVGAAGQLVLLCDAAMVGGYLDG